MNYYDFFGLPIALHLDTKALRARYIANSRQYHPDFYTLQDDVAQQKALDNSTLNNEAYNTLRKPDSRLRYFLQLHDALPEEGQAKLPQDFLMEMMEVNEALMELQMDYDTATHERLSRELQQRERELYDRVRHLMERTADTTYSTQELELLTDYYLKRRYLLRLQNNIAKVREID